MFMKRAPGLSQLKKGKHPMQNLKLMAGAVAVLAVGSLGGVAAAGSAMAASTPAPAIVQQAPSNADPLNLHAGQPGGPASSTPKTFDPAVKPDTVPVSGKICLNAQGQPVTGGNCWWESAVQLWYNMKQGTNESAEMATVYSEYGGDFQDGWTDDDAWWGITFQLANQLYGTASYLTKADNLWTYDTTTGWDSACGGSTLQHSGGTEDDISRAALGELAHALGKTSSSSNAASWIYDYMQGGDTNDAASEGLDGGTCVASGSIAELGGQAESWKVENVNSALGQPGTKASAIAQYPDSDYNGAFNELYTTYGL